MTWKEAIISVLTDEGRAMTYSEISQMIFSKRYRSEEKATHVNSLLTTNPDLFRMRGEGFYELRNTFVVDRPCSSYPSSDGKYKPASVFKNYEALSDLEMKLLELIVNFRIPLTVNREVCFADILDKLEVHISNDEKKRTQSVDATLLRQKLEELNSQINNNQGEQLETLLKNMSQVQELLGNTIDGMVQLPSYTILGEFFRDENNPRVVIYLESIKKKLKNHESRQDVMAAVFVHEMFHAWNYFNAGPNPEKSVREIEEPMVEFETLYFLQELEAYTKTHSHSMHKNVLSVRETRESRVKRKQQSIGDVAAYGFGYYLYEKLSERDVDSITWIETYSKKSASIKSVKKVKDALIPIYPFKSEKQVMNWFKKIIFDTKATSKTAGTPTTAKGTSATAKDGIDISLRNLVLACIEMIGRKCFDAQELYAFAPIFKVCVPECKNLESALKHQLDELVKEGFLEALSDDCYRKLEGVEIKPKSPSPTSPTTPVSTPIKSKGGRTKAPSIAFKVEFPDDKITYEEETAVMTYIESLKHIGLSRVQSLGKKHWGRYDLVSNVEDPDNSGNSLQHYEGGKYIYTKLGNEQKKGYLYQIANELGIKISIRDI